jgi:DnaD/phage-associated family protein
MVASEPEEFTFGGDFEPVTVMWFLLNTTANRDFVAGLESGKISLENTTLVEGLDPWEWAIPPDPATTTVSSAKETIERWKELRLTSGRDDIYNLYEQNIGVLTPLISDKLREAEKLYPADWIEYAFEQAVTYNRRSWAYISRILENWATEGRIQDGNGNEREGQTARGFASRSGGNERGNLAIAGAGTTGSQPENAGPPAGPGRHPTPNKSGRPGPRSAPGNAEIDFNKYTTGKYAYLTGERQRPRPAAKNGDE